MTLLLTACGGDEGGADPLFTPDDTEGGDEVAAGGRVQQSGDRTVTANIGPAGGTLTLSNGAWIEIPAGALAETTEVTLSIGSASAAFNNRDDERLIGPVLQIQPALVAQPGKTFTVSAPIPALTGEWADGDLTLAHEVIDDDQRALGMGGTQTTWVFADATADGARATARLPQLAGFRVQFLVSLQ